MAIIFRMTLNEKVAIHINRIAAKILYNYRFFPCYECMNGEIKQGQILEFVSTNNDEQIRFFVFLKHCMRQYDGLSFEQWDVHREHREKAT